MEDLKYATARMILVGPVLDTDGLPYTTNNLTRLDFLATTPSSSVELVVGTTVAHSHQGHFLIALQTLNTAVLGGLRITLNKVGLAMPPWVGNVRPPAWFNVIANTWGGSLPNAAADAAGGLPISDAGGLDLDTLLGRLDVGARTITVTVDDGIAPLESARVRFTKGAESKRGTTDVAGKLVIGLDDGTWSAAVTLPLYSFTPTTLVVSQDAAVTYSMTAESITPSDPGFVTGYLYCYDKDGALEAGVEVEMQQSERIAGTGVANNWAARTDTTGLAGLAEFVNLFLGATYRLRRKSGLWREITIPADAQSPYALPDLLGG